MTSNPTTHDDHVANIQYDCPVDSDGDVIDPESCINYIRSAHPNCVLVY